MADLNMEDNIDEVDERSLSAESETNSIQQSLDHTEGEDDLAARENQAVSYLRNTVLSVLLAATFICSTCVYISGRSHQAQKFRAEFDNAAKKVLGSFHTSMENKLKSLEIISVDIASISRSNKDGWPTVLIPDFAERGASIRALAQLPSILVTPVVNSTNRKAWEHFSTENQQWVEESIEWENAHGNTKNIWTSMQRALSPFPNISDHIFDESGKYSEGGQHFPLFQLSPMSKAMIAWVNVDLGSVAAVSAGLELILNRHIPVLGKAIHFQNEASGSPLSFVKSLVNDTTTGSSGPFSFLSYPILLNRYGPRPVVSAVLTSFVDWSQELASLATSMEDSSDMVAVISSSCDDTFSMHIGRRTAYFIGGGDQHDRHFRRMAKSTTLSHPISSSSSLHNHLPIDDAFCRRRLTLYPSQVMERAFTSSQPFWFTMAVTLAFFAVCGSFVLYDHLVERRQKVVMDRAIQSTNIISSLFPHQVRDRLFHDDCNDTDMDPASAYLNASLTSTNSELMVQPAKNRLKSFLSDNGSEEQVGNKPIADLFPNCTVLFADIAGFTAWSSLRDPAQVFMLLEGVYGAFDSVARRRGVFKVETVGDSYVAVTGLPDPQDDHAVIMARFARDCRVKMKEVTRKLELTLGPDTGDLAMRFGLHSGPVTAGVLRGEKSRFQLFGDTVNTAARMESTGERDRIQCSQATADLLRFAGKGRWLQARDTLVNAKGKGQLQTHWIEIFSGSHPHYRRSSNSSQDSRHSGTSCEESPPEKSMLWGIQEDMKHDDPQRCNTRQRSKHQRLVDYNVDLLSQHLKMVIARRQTLHMVGRRCSQGGLPTQLHSFSTDETNENNVLNEVKEVIRLPHFNARSFKVAVDPENVQLDPKVLDQLKRYVSVIAAMYRANPFHNFEHASHVTMSVNKLLSRVVAPENFTYRRGSMTSGERANQIIASNLHNYTFGITSDPLTQLAVVFGALIHDVDHWGVSNAQLVKEGSPVAQQYGTQSIAEQNSVDRAWDLLLDEDEFGELQAVIFPTEAEYKRFRQVVVNVVMATDIFDKELNELRRNRWANAFDKDGDVDPESENRKATIVIEHIMQASDVAHSMQHWLVYQKWNRRLFDELYSAYLKGRMEVNPADFWYQGEIKFFEGYVIPLAKKLKECAVFGVASDECLNYAIENLQEWKKKGKMISAELVANYHQRELEEQAQSTGTATQQRKKRGKMNRRRSLMTQGG